MGRGGICRRMPEEEKNRGEMRPWFRLARMAEGGSWLGREMNRGGARRVRAFFKGDGCVWVVPNSSSDWRLVWEVVIYLGEWDGSVCDGAVGEVGSDVGVKRDAETASNEGSQLGSVYVKPYRPISGVFHCCPRVKLVRVGEAGR